MPQRRAMCLPSVCSSEHWEAHFRANRAARLELPKPTPPARLDARSVELLGGSIAEFELGESSEGRHLLGFARAWGRRSGDEAYPRAMAHFIAEENDHARYLRAIMQQESMPKATKTAADSVFRGVRKLGGLELSIMVLVTAEIIAQVYYRGLRDASGSPELRAVCRRILADEKHHIDFQCERLAIVRQTRSVVTLWRRRWTHRAMMTAAVLVVWRTHGPALREGGYTFGKFARHSAAKFRRAMRIADPRGYAWAGRAALATV